MALYDHRVFRTNNEWWIAEVHMASGAGAGHADEPPYIPMSRETVIFTSMSDKDAISRSIRIPADHLNRIRHDCLTGLLARSRDWQVRLPMHPYNLPSPEAFPHRNVLLDDEGLRWGYREIGSPVLSPRGELEEHPAVELMCFDDSGLSGVVGLSGPARTLAEVASALGASPVPELIKAVKSKYITVEPLEGP